MTCPPHGGDINCLSLHGATLSNSLGVFSWTSGLDGLDENTEWILVCLKMDQFKGLLDDEASLQFLAAVPAVEHQSINQPLDDGALGFSEP